MKEFRFDISFLRFIAVTVVLLYHFKIPFFTGGFSGVDIFFVISGFLMTKIILTGYKNKTFRLLSFYNKRFKRIVPPLLIAAIGILFLSNMLFLTNEIQQNSKNILLSSVFLSNIYFWFHTDYFAPEAQNNIFLHSWSLAVEWQFYIIYPLLLYPLKKLYFNNERLFKTLFILLTLISFLFCLDMNEKNSSFTFYMIPTRAWEMLLGGIAFLYCKNVIFFNHKLKLFLIAVSYLAILLSVVYLNESIVWPSLFTLIPVISTFIIILLNVNLSFYKWKPFKFIGDISYEIYLWHWPIYVTFIYFELKSWEYIFLMMFLSVLISSLSYFYLNKIKFIQSFKGILVLLLFVLLTSYYCFVSSYGNIISSTISFHSKELQMMAKNVVRYSETDKVKQFNSCNCFITDNSDYSIFNESKCLTLDSSKRNIVLIGDSHAAQFSLSFREKLPVHYNLLEVSAGYSFPFLQPRGKKESKELFQKYYNFIDENYHSIEKVFVSVHWEMKNIPEMKYTDEEIRKNILEMIDYYKGKNIKLYFIGQSENYQKSFYKIIMLNYYYPEKKYEYYIDPNSIKMNDFLKSFIPKENYIDIFNINNISKYDQKNSMPYISDKNHFTKYGADQIVDHLLDTCCFD